MEGHTEYDVAKKFQTDTKRIAQVLDTVANRIKKINDLAWKYEFVYTNKIKANFTYKTCSTCGNSKPATDDFFGKDNRNKDGFKSRCKKCDANRKNGGQDNA